jgi:hypothetical protein
MVRKGEEICQECFNSLVAGQLSDALISIYHLRESLNVFVGSS